MKVLNLLFFILIFFNSSVFGQIVTPSLDASVLSLVPATAGWRDKTNFNGSLETFSETDFDSNESNISNVSYMVSSRLVNNIYQESFSSTSNVEKKYSNLFANLNEKSKKDETKFNVAIGLGKPIGGNTHRYFLELATLQEELMKKGLFHKQLISAKHIIRLIPLGVSNGKLFQPLNLIR